MGQFRDRFPPILMWVRLTALRLRHIEQAVPSALFGELSVERVQRTRSVVDVRAPAIAWALVRDGLRKDIFTRSGRLHRDVPRALASSLHIVTSTLGDLERHPALRGTGRIGTHAEVIPAWTQQLDDRDRVFSPYPGAGEFVVLKPMWHSFQGRQVTTWGEEGESAGEDRLAEEETHLGVLRRCTVLE